jgi:hypothetical protein
MMSSILKNLKRVMAAEYSRELSEKVYAGACRFVQLGFKAGGPVGYGLRRQLVDEYGRPKAVLEQGHRKYLQTDHVRLLVGTQGEVSVVRWIFEEFLRKKSEAAIARTLNERAVSTQTDRPWNGALIGRILRNENYIGNLIYNRRSRKLRDKYTHNPPKFWIRAEGCVEPVVDRDVFARVQKIVEGRRIDLSEEQMLVRLRRTLMRHGTLSARLINKGAGLPCAATYIKRFGSLIEAYRLIG